MSTSVTVILCAFTEDRWDDLIRAHTSLHLQTRPPHQIVVVIDHNDALLARARAAFEAALVVPNAHEQGLSGARNTGLAAATEQVVAFLDDDAVADARWLERMVVHFAAEEVVGVGGFATPEWDGGTAPGWFPQEFLWVVGCSYSGLPGDGATIRNPIGCSMAFRREAVVAEGGFTSALGRVGRKPLGCEETELAIRISQSRPSSRIVHAASASVAHRVREDRQTVRYLTRRCYWEGVSKARLSRLTGSSAALSSERTYVSHALVGGLGVRARDFAAGPSSSPVAQSAVMVLGVAAAGIGYVRGRFVGDRRAPVRRG